jgi:hypothetical protein
MSFAVYGIRLKGDTEVRYIGQTRQELRTRHFNHRGEAANRPLRDWLRQSGAANVDIFEIARCNTLEQALVTEKVIIALCVRLNHRLFNRDGVPKHLRSAA